MSRFVITLAVSLACATLAVSGCQQQQAPKADAPKATEPATPAAPAAPALGSFTKTGTITKVADAGYPLFLVTVDFGGGEIGEFTWNNEEATLTGAPKDSEIESLIGKSASIAYTRAETLDAVSIKHNGKEVLDWPSDTGVPRPTPETIVTGVLSGAGKMTDSDLPDALTVKDAAGKDHTFEHFVSERALIAANNKPVEVGFRKVIRESITAITMPPPAAAR